MFNGRINKTNLSKMSDNLKALANKNDPSLSKHNRFNTVIALVKKFATENVYEMFRNMIIID